MCGVRAAQHDYPPGWWGVEFVSYRQRLSLGWFGWFEFYGVVSE